MSTLQSLLAGLLAAGAVPVAAQTPFTELVPTDTLLTDGATSIDSAAPADVDGDGDLDLLTVGYTGNTSRIVLYLNGEVQGDSSWAVTPVDVPFPSAAAGYRADLAWGDYDDDGDPDVVVGLSDEIGAGFGRMALYRNDAGTLVLTPTALPRYGESTDYDMLDHRSLTWADADNDGDLDLLVPSARSQSGFETLPTTLLRNDGPGAGDAWAFAPAAQLPQTYNAVTAWADQDADGDLDLLLAEFAGSASFTQTYQNDGGALTPAGPALPDIWEGTADWGDADGDGDLDVLVAGLLYEDGDFTAYDVRVYLDAGTGYETLVVVDPAVETEWRQFTAASWADYDSDGDVDILVAGQLVVTGPDGFPEFAGQARVYANDGAGGFTLAAELPAPNSSQSQRGGTFVWFDVDADGDLDYFVTGAYGVDGSTGNEFEFRAQLFRNDTPVANAAPTAPLALAAAPSSDGVALSWAAATDDATPVASLTYNLHVRARDGSDIVSPMSRPGGTRMLPEAGNVSHNTAWALSGLEPGEYTWTVQAVDNAFNGGPFAAEGTFTVGPVAGEPAAGAVALAIGVAPSPASGPVVVTVALTGQATVRVAVFDALGREVAVVHDGPLAAGPNALRLDGAALPAGVYVVRASGGGVAASRTVTVVR